MFYYRIVQSKTLALLCLPPLLIGCSENIKTVQQPTPPVQPKSPIVAIANTHAIRQDNLWSALIELGGVEVLQEYILTLELNSALQQRGFSILPNDLEEEEQLFLTLASDVPGMSDVTVNEMLLKRGYGKIRKTELLWRNAALRKLVQDQVSLSDEAVHRMFSIVHGPSYPTRIIVVSTLEEANKVISRIQLGESFSDVAIDISIDSSASRGGQVESISTADPIWPAPIRETISTIEVNTISNPIFIGDRWVVLKVGDAPTTSKVLFEDVETEMRQLAKVAGERFLMETLSNSLLQNSDVKIIDIDLLRTSRSNANSTK